MKVVVCGSYGDMDGFLYVLRTIRNEFGARNVFPSDEHIKKSQICIEAHHKGLTENELIRSTRSQLVGEYLTQISQADLVVIRNEKYGKEYYGIGTTIELGYALAKKKKIRFIRKPTNPNIVSILSEKCSYVKTDLL